MIIIQSELPKENKSAWKKKYDEFTLDEQLLNLDIQSPENFIDDLKIKYLKSLLPKKGIIVEVGAGSGRLITRIGLENKNCKLIGFDYGSFSINLIKENIAKFNLNGTAMWANAFCIPFKSNSVDAVVSGGLLEHFNETEIKVVIQEMIRILKPEGLFYADIVPAKSSLCRPIILTKHCGGYENNFTKNQWKKILDETSLKNVKIFSGCIIPVNFYGWFRSGLKLKIIYKLQPYINKLDDTKLSDILGFMYYAFARKQMKNKI